MMMMGWIIRLAVLRFCNEGRNYLPWLVQQSNLRGDEGKLWIPCWSSHKLMKLLRLTSKCVSKLRMSARKEHFLSSSRISQYQLERCKHLSGRLSSRLIIHSELWLFLGGSDGRLERRWIDQGWWWGRELISWSEEEDNFGGRRVLI